MYALRFTSLVGLLYSVDFEYRGKKAFIPFLNRYPLLFMGNSSILIILLFSDLFLYSCDLDFLLVFIHGYLM